MAECAYFGNVGGEQAASVLLQIRMDQLASRGQLLNTEEQSEFKRPTLENYEREGSPYYSTARLWDDGILDPIDTRMAIGLGIDAACRAPAGRRGSACSECDANLDCRTGSDAT